MFKTPNIYKQFQKQFAYIYKQFKKQFAYISLDIL